jgi:hypothetical protein
MRECAVCGAPFEEAEANTVFSEAGQWLAAEVWHDDGTLCPSCLENRARLAMMYVVDR